LEELKKFRLSKGQRKESEIIRKIETQEMYDILTQASLSGISLQRWQNSTTAMIEKLPGCTKINKLRVIHLYEADYNVILKIIWARKLVWNVHDNNRINEGQAGSRPGFNAIDIVIQKEMKYLYSRLTKTNLATMDNDAKRCYDRIICNLAMIISQYYGVTQNMASLHATTLRKMKYRLRTALGESTQIYQHSAETPIHGTGQGSCASPAIWLLISSILMDCLSPLGGGMTLHDVVKNNSIQQWIDGFVDYTTLFTNIIQRTNDNDITQLCHQLTRDMTIWIEFLEASGSKLELSKCFYYVLSWKFDNDGNSVPMTIMEQRAIQVPPITIIAENNSPVTILQKEVNQAHKH
jgi:Reverse transcriptase (RNA-dependent DNA polymerase)